MTRRLRLALPFTVLREPDTVRLVAGEDFRYTFSAPGLDRWMPELVARLDGRATDAELLDTIEPARREAARELLDRLAGERIAVAASAADAHAPARRRLAIEGRGALRDALARLSEKGDGAPLPVLCQDRLDYDEAFEFNARCLATSDAWTWATTGPGSRGFAGPVFVRGAGPCLACVVAQFERLSPAPELYGALSAHARSGGEILPVPFPEHGVEVLARLVVWKTELLALAEPAAAVYRLHVVEAATLEVTSHRPLYDPECAACR